MQIRAIGFDLFNTLITCDLSLLPSAVINGREQPSTLPHLQEVLEHAGHTVDLDRLDEVKTRISTEQDAEKHRTGREIPSAHRWAAVLTALEIPPTEALVTRVVEAHMRTLCGAWNIAEAEREALHRMRERYPIALLSNFDHGPSARALLDRLELTSLFGYVGISDDLGWRKPEAQLFDGVLKALAVEADACLFVGDSVEHDIAGAQSVGMPSVWLQRSNAPYPADAAPPTFQAANLVELEAHLAGAVGRSRPA